MKGELPRLLLAGTRSGCGKTTAVCAVLRALADRGVNAAAFKCGPDYIDPMFHSRALGGRCYNLDLCLFGEETLKYLLLKHGAGHGLALIEGAMGYYDGVGTTDRASAWDVSRAASAPAVLVADARGAARSLLAEVKGFLTLRPDSGIRGVLFNNCSPGLYPRVAEEFRREFAGAAEPLGFLPPMPDCAFESRRLGLVAAGELDGLQKKLRKLGKQAERTVDLDGLLRLAGSAGELSCAPPALPVPGPPVRVGVAADRAFCFRYEDNLELLAELGAELVFFSPLADETLPPDLDGLYLGGGYPELYAGALAENGTMRASVREALRSGLPCVAECGGFLYLQDKLGGEPMAGVFPGKGFDRKRLTRFGYLTLTAKTDSLLFRAGERVPAHEFHYWDVDEPGSDLLAEKGEKRWACGFASPRLYAGFPHLHFWSAPETAGRFLDQCREERRRRACKTGRD